MRRHSQLFAYVDDFNPYYIFIKKKNIMLLTLFVIAFVMNVDIAQFS